MNKIAGFSWLICSGGMATLAVWQLTRTNGDMGWAANDVGMAVIFFGGAMMFFTSGRRT